MLKLLRLRGREVDCAMALIANAASIFLPTESSAYSQGLKLLMDRAPVVGNVNWVMLKFLKRKNKETFLTLESVWLAVEQIE